LFVSDILTTQQRRALQEKEKDKDKDKDKEYFNTNHNIRNNSTMNSQIQTTKQMPTLRERSFASLLLLSSTVCRLPSIAFNNEV
jgi:hypothetical protein